MSNGADLRCPNCGSPLGNVPDSLASTPCPACGAEVQLAAMRPTESPETPAPGPVATPFPGIDVGADKPAAPGSPAAMAPGVGPPSSIPSDAVTPGPMAPIPPHLRGPSDQSPAGIGPIQVPSGPPKVGGLQLNLAEDDARGFRHKPPKFKHLGLILSGISISILSLTTIGLLALRFAKPDWFAAESVPDRIDVKYIRGQYESQALDPGHE
ncbi:MAG: hypothetical protein R3B96_16315 [Pirellulaceae bacterium]